MAKGPSLIIIIVIIVTITTVIIIISLTHHLAHRPSVAAAVGENEGGEGWASVFWTWEKSESCWVGRGAQSTHLHALQQLHPHSLVTLARAAGTVGRHRAQARRVKEAVAAAALRNDVHLEREQRHVRAANLAEMAEGGAGGARHHVLLSGGGSVLHPPQQWAAVHLLQVHHAVPVLFDVTIMHWGKHELAHTSSCQSM
jgi:hypothetical protein